MGNSATLCKDSGSGRGCDGGGGQGRGATGAVERGKGQAVGVGAQLFYEVPLSPMGMNNNGEILVPSYLSESLVLTNTKVPIYNESASLTNIVIHFYTSHF